MLAFSICITTLIVVEFGDGPAYEDNDLAPPAGALPAASPSAVGNASAEPAP
jgi:hypothetical protein